MPEMSGVWSGACRLAPTRTDAEDLLQETMLRAFRAFDPARPPAAPRAWLQTILMNLARDLARRDGRSPKEVSLDDEGAGLFERLQAGVETGPFSDPARLVRRWESRDMIRSALDNLPEASRQVLVLAHVAGLRYREIAEVLDLPLGTVMSRLSRARRALARAVADDLRLPDPPDPRIAASDPRGRGLADEVRRSWGGAAAAVDALAASPSVAASAAAATRVMTEEGALTAGVKRALLGALDDGVSPGGPGLAALAALAVRAVRAPAELARSDYEEVYALGWTEPQVLEALHVVMWATYLRTLDTALGGGEPDSREVE